MFLCRADQALSKGGIEIEDMRFHQCVRLGRFDKDRAITFIPPDGAFELMTYRVSEYLNFPFKILANVQESSLNKNRLGFNISVKSSFDRNNYANKVAISIPLPSNVSHVFTSTISGRAKHEPENGGVVWRINKFPGQAEITLRLDADLIVSNVQSQWVRPPISISFDVPMFTASGLRVRFLRIIDKTGYKATKWIRYLTKSGTYEQKF